MKKLLLLASTTLMGTLCIPLTITAALPAAMQPDTTSPLETTPSCNSQEKLVLVVNNPTTEAIQARATYKLNVAPGIRLNPSPNPNVNFTIPASSFNVIVCLDKDKKGAKLLGKLSSVTFFLDQKSITKTFDELKNSTISLQ